MGWFSVTRWAAAISIFGHQQRHLLLLLPLYAFSITLVVGFFDVFVTSMQHHFGIRMHHGAAHRHWKDAISTICTAFNFFFIWLSPLSSIFLE
jgi:hypothetical protein